MAFLESAIIITGDDCMSIYNSADKLIGNTPLLRLANVEAKYGLKAKLLAKLEFMNPTGSAKDRAAKWMIDGAEARGDIKEGSVIIEPTSGNTGIGLAAVGGARGYKVIIVMPDTMSKERITLMRAYGAEVVLTDGTKGMAGAIAKAQELAESTEGAFIPDQFANPDNAKAHFDTTGPEIWADTDGEVDIFVAGAGTGGTVTGTGRFLKSKKDVKIVAVEPAESPILSGGKPGSHRIQGIGAGFVPDVLDVSVIDEVCPVSSDDAYDKARMLGVTEGILAGISSGAALHSAIEVCKREENTGKTVVVLLPDGGDRYLSGDLYE